MREQAFFYYLAGVPLLGIAAQWLAWRLRLPSILLLLGIGVAVGSLVSPDELLAHLAGVDTTTTAVGSRVLFPIVSLSVAVILFEGGLTLRFHELREAGSGVLRLVTVGALSSWLLTSVAGVLLMDLDGRIATLVGAILVVTGPTVVAPMLRQIQPARRIASTVKWEGIVIDPIGAILAVLVFEFVFAHAGHSSLAAISATLIKTIVVGSVSGLVTAAFLVQSVKRYWIPDFLHGVVFLTVAMGVFALSNLLQEESGLVTVTILGIALANQKSISIHHVLEFKEHLRVLLISCLFIVLGSRVDPRNVWNLGIGGASFLAVLILIVRPASVLLATIRSPLTFSERIFLGFLAPRGIVAAAVSSVFALKLASWSGLTNEDFTRQADAIVPITFLVIAGTVFAYGLFAAPLARWLKLADPNPQGILFASAEPGIREIAQQLQREGFPVLLIDTNYAHIAAAKMEGVPAECASVLSDHVREELDLAGIGRLLAMTANDEVNSLAVREFSYLFGRANVYQLTPWDEGSGKRTSVSEHLRGRLLFGKHLNHDALAARFLVGNTVKSTKLSDEFSFEHFRARYSDSAIVLFVIDEAKKLTVCSPDTPLEPKAGQTIIALVEPADSQDASNTHKNSSHGESMER
ncbi:MAG: sodium:proton antiporter [Planctomycetaceae bacterium]|nr:sodium:proton antiporter [Planctomycetaceae bacterium]